MAAISLSNSSTSFLLGLTLSWMANEGSLAPLVLISLGGRMSPQFFGPYLLLLPPMLLVVSPVSGELSLVVLVVTVVEHEGELLPLSLPRSLSALSSATPVSSLSPVFATFCLFLPLRPLFPPPLAPCSPSA